MSGGGPVRLPRVLVAARDAGGHAALLAQAFPGLPVTAVAEEAGPEHLAGAEVLVTIGRWLKPDLAARAAGLKWVQCLITGTDHLVPAMRARPDLIVTNARGIHGPQMAETAFFHMLSLARGGTRLARMQAARQSERIVPMVLNGRTVAILGIGSIAETLGQRCKAFGMRVVGVSRSPRAVAGFDAILPREKLHEAMAAADFVVVLVPATPETVGMVDGPLLAAMKPGAHLINLSRGDVVDDAALLAALRDGRIGGAGLDVFRTFPLPPDSPLWEAGNIVITPWIGGQSDRYVEDVSGIIRDNLARYMQGNLAAMTNRIGTRPSDAG